MPPPPVLPGSDVIAFVLGDLALILIAARIVGEIFVRVKQPRVVGEIIAGVLIGPTVLGGHLATPATPGHAAIVGAGLVDQIYPLQSFTFLNLIGQVGLVFFMFLVGVELDARLLKGRGLQITALALSVVVVPVALGFVVAAVLGDATWKPPGVGNTTFALLMGAGLSVTAFPVMARILQEKGLMATNMGAVGVGSAAVVTVLMFLVIAAASASAKGTGLVDQVGIKFGLTIVLIAVLLLVVRPLMGLAMRGYRDNGPLTGTLLAAFLILALATGLAADRIGINGLVGGFLAGLAIPHRPGLSETVSARMEDAVVLFFLPVFLAVSGLRTDLRVLSLALVPAVLFFLGLMIVGKWGVALVVGRLVGVTTRQANTLGVLLNCRGLLILVVALIGLDLKAMTGAMQAVFVIGAIVTTLMTGPLVDYFTREEAVPEDADRRASGVAILTQ
jgi:Kef-type K+ transport system membrane component KefB